ncbi:glycosyltransferase family 4 protein [Kitasatospora sp. RB6PN24]|uniref:glycosyltransferase family 4 protein n=1 Tax=Kitasatospora humi TaxID=2893891 RepID=UPI001E4D6FCB|nr:glycosyltransferase family 4 protein [Kitasatospora humi]MCC9311281.1 glycosyltransferase family 4 protein [Kitasatospora humi]
MPREVIASVVRVPWHSTHGGYDRLLDHLPETRRIGPPSTPLTRGLTSIGHLVGRRLCPLPFYPARHFATDLRILADRKPAHVLYGDEQFWFSQHRAGPTAVTYHQPAPQLARLLPPAAWRRLLPRASRIITLDPVQRAFFADRLPAHRVHLVPHGIDTTAFRPGHPLQPGNRPMVLTVGWWLRDWDVLDTVHWRLHRRYGEDVDLVVVTREAATRSWHPAVRVLENVAEPVLVDLYQRAAAVVLPLIDATANNALLEAMACGAPVVATDVGGISYYTGSAALLTEPGDPVAATEAVESLLAEAGTAADRARREAARARAEQFAWPAVAEQVRDVYRKLVTDQ